LTEIHRIEEIIGQNDTKLMDMHKLIVKDVNRTLPNSQFF